MRRLAVYLFCGLSVTANAAANLPVGGRAGYISSVTDERKVAQEEFVVLPPPPPVQSNLLILDRPLVDAKLSREFQAKYDEKFGRTDAERLYNSSNQFALYEYPGGKLETIDAHEHNQLTFANFMFRRLAEHHIDQYAKSNPDIRPIYELKDRIANVSVQMKKGYKMRIKYSYSGNSLDLRLENPYDVDTKVTMEMADGFGPSHVDRTIFSVGMPITKKTSVAAHQEWDRSAGTTLIGSRKLTNTLSTSLSTSLHTPVDRDDPLLKQRHDLVLLGLTWTE